MTTPLDPIFQKPGLGNLVASGAAASAVARTQHSHQVLVSGLTGLTASMVGTKNLVLTGMAYVKNNGVFPIREVLSATEAVVLNPAFQPGDPNSGSAAWEVRSPFSMEEAFAEGAQAAASAVLTAAAEAADAIVVSGQMRDADGDAVAGAVPVVVETFAPTDAKGAITVTVGTQVVNTGAPAGKLSTAVVTTTAAGAFAVSVADDAAESVLVRVTTPGGRVSHLLLTFA